MSKKILIIDDEADFGEMVKDLLSEKYTVITAIDVEQGLKTLEVEMPRLVLLDILMPKLGGLECLRRIKQMAPDTIVVIVSGMQDESVAKEAIRRGAYDYVTKPFDFARFEKDILSRVF